MTEVDTSWVEKVYDPQCSKCDLCKQATHRCIPGRGNPNADFMLVGEAPGYNEDIHNTPFIGRELTGRILLTLLAGAPTACYERCGSHRDAHQYCLHQEKHPVTGGHCCN